MSHQADHSSAADPDPFDTDSDPDPAFCFDTDPEPAFQFDLDRTVRYGPGILLFQRTNVPKTAISIHLNLIFLVSRPPGL
jgi:hypothetical protein